MYNHLTSLVYSSEWTTIFRNQWILSPEYALLTHLEKNIRLSLYAYCYTFYIFLYIVCKMLTREFLLQAKSTLLHLLLPLNVLAVMHTHVGHQPF